MTYWVDKGSSKDNRGKPTGDMYEQLADDEKTLLSVLNDKKSPYYSKAGSDYYRIVMKKA